MKNPNGFLPIGSVILLKESEKRLVINGIMQTAEKEEGTEEYFDYVGVLYPEGFLGVDSMYLFNHEDIAVVSFIGFHDAERQVFLAAIDNEMKTKDDQ